MTCIRLGTVVLHICYHRVSIPPDIDGSLSDKDGDLNQAREDVGVPTFLSPAGRQIHEPGDLQAYPVRCLGECLRRGPCSPIVD